MKSKRELSVWVKRKIMCLRTVILCCGLLLYLRCFCCTGGFLIDDKEPLLFALSYGPAEKNGAIKKGYRSNRNHWMSLGTMGFIFGLICLRKIQKLIKDLKKSAK